MSENEAQLIDIALAENLISSKQAQMVRNELRMFPNQKAAASLVRHHYLTEEQLADLRVKAGMSASVPAAGQPTAPPLAAVHAASVQPARPAPHVASVQASPSPAPISAVSEPMPAEVAEPEAHDARRAGDSTIGGRTEQQPGPNWSPLNAAVNAATKHGQKLSAPPPPPLEAHDDADTGTEMMGMLRRRGVVRQPVEPAATPAPTAPVPVAAPQPPSAPKRKDRSADLQRLKALLVTARNDKASDLHLSPGRAPFTRGFGLINYPDLPALNAEESEDLCLSCLTPRQEDQIREDSQLDFSFEFSGGGRYRCNVYRQRLGWEGAFRIVPDHVPTMSELGLPDALERLTEYHQGMILVTGPSGSGKTTTVASMIQHINESRPDHIITLEDPVEYVFEPKQCQITQREIGVHTKSFAQALRAALREDPDVILVGELRDVETISIASSAAETGHLVFGTLHTGSAARSVARIIDSYPPEQREQASSMISKSVRGVISQQLIPRKDGAGLALALEILIFTSAVSSMVRDGKTHQLQSAMQSGKRAGMKLMDESLTELVQKGIITGREAWHRAENKQPFEGMKDR